MRKTPQQRVAEYKSKAAQIEQREARKLRAQSPQWKATKRARAAIRDAYAVIADSKDEQDVDLGEALATADDSLAQCARAQIDQVPQ